MSTGPKEITIPAEYLESFVYPDDDEAEIPDVVLPSKMEVCDCCQGNGSIVNPSIDGHGITREEFDNDPEFRESYFSGVYDIRCPECDGLRVVRVLDEARCTDEQIKAYRRMKREEYLDRQEYLMEARYFGYDR